MFSAAQRLVTQQWCPEFEPFELKAGDPADPHNGCRSQQLPVERHVYLFTSVLHLVFILHFGSVVLGDFYQCGSHMLLCFGR